jgi:hypothetical protein
MSEADVVRAALDEICSAAYAVDCDLPEHAKARAAHVALDAVVERAERAEAALESLRRYGLSPTQKAILARREARDE